MAAGRRPPAGRALVVAAHVDDDGVGLGAALRAAPEAAIVYLTDSAPRDPRFFTTPCRSRPAYAARRWREARAAAARLGLPRHALHRLGATDMEAFRELARLETALTRLAAHLAPAVVWSPAYEGSHPDHDVAAFLAARLAAARRLPHREFALYSWRRGLAPLRFGSGPPGRIHRLPPALAAWKSELVAIYASQAPLLHQFPCDHERYRPAPAYDFTRRPLPGPTLYERWGWAMRADMLVSAFATVLRRPIGASAPRRVRAAR